MSIVSIVSKFSWKNFAKEELRYVGQILCCTFFLFLSGQFFIPYYPIPCTLQTFGIMILSLFFSPQSLFMGGLLWLSLGIIGLPVFSGLQGGFFIVLGVKGGYILSMILGAPLLSLCIQSLKNTEFSQIKKACYSFLVFLCFSLFVLACGSVVYGFLVQDYQKALLFGVAPFFLGEILKSITASSLCFLDKK